MDFHWIRVHWFEVSALVLLALNLWFVIKVLSLLKVNDGHWVCVATPGAPLSARNSLSAGAA